MSKASQKIRFLVATEIFRIIETMPDDFHGRRDKAMIEVLFSTGLRVSEMLALRRDVFTGKADKTMELDIVGKGGFQRTIYFSPRAQKAVYRYLAIIPDYDERERLFPITARRVQMILKRRAKEAGVEKFISPHILRHSLATDLLKRGVDIRFVGEFLGHRNLNNTMIYTHVVNEQLRKIHKDIYK